MFNVVSDKKMLRQNIVLIERTFSIVPTEQCF